MICIDDKLLKFKLDLETGKLNYRSQIEVKSIPDGYYSAVKTEEKIFLFMNSSLVSEVILFYADFTRICDQLCISNYDKGDAVFT